MKKIAMVVAALAAMLAASPVDPSSTIVEFEIVGMEDEEYRSHVYLREERHRKIAEAMTTRVLTKKEFAEVLSFGSGILKQDGVPYYPEEVEARFDRMMEIQTRLRMYSEHLKRMEKK